MHTELITEEIYYWLLRGFKYVLLIPIGESDDGVMHLIVKPFPSLEELTSYKAIFYSGAQNVSYIETEYILGICLEPMFLKVFKEELDQSHLSLN